MNMMPRPQPQCAAVKPVKRDWLILQPMGKAGRLRQQIQFKTLHALFAVAEGFDLLPDELTGAGRCNRIAHPRFLAYELAKERGLCPAHIGKLFGGRDHKTIMQGLNRLNELRQSNPAFAAKCEAVKRRAAELERA